MLRIKGSLWLLFDLMCSQARLDIVNQQFAWISSAVAFSYQHLNILDSKFLTLINKMKFKFIKVVSDTMHFFHLLISHCHLTEISFLFSSLKRPN